MRRLLALAPLLLMCHAAAHAQTSARTDFQRGLAAYNVDDYATAVREFTAAADRGDPAAQLYRLAAEKGEPRAQYNLGIAYDRGLGVDLDRAEAARWYERAAEVGDPYAQNSFGVKLARGEGGLEQDLPRAYMWFSLAASRHPAGSDREAALQNRRLVERQMTSNQMAQAERLARFWRPKKPEPLEYGPDGISPVKKTAQ